MKRTRLKNHLQDAQIFNRRLITAVVCVILLTTALIVRMYFLQIAHHSIYVARSETNRIRIQPIAPRRGLIFDHSGTIVADNHPSFSAVINEDQVINLEETLAAAQPLLNLTADDLQRFRLKMKRYRRPHEPIPLKLNLNEEEIARVAINQFRLKGVELHADLLRYYPYGPLLAHALGYVGRINPNEEKQLDERNYAATHYLGKTGVEKYYEEKLHGIVGNERVETTAHGQTLRTVGQTPPIPGTNLTLYLDLPTQIAADEALGTGRGSVVAIDPATGGIIAWVSKPSFDPNLFVTGIDQKTFSALNLSWQRPLINRPLKGEYPPGSTIKPLMGLAGLENKSINWKDKISDPGYFRLGGRAHQYRDWKKEGHGIVDLHKAIVQSCDTYFYILANKLGINQISTFFRPFGFGQSTEIDMPGERIGVLPSAAWKRARLGQVWYPGETLITGIGQGFFLVTPLQLATATAQIANRGIHVTPKMVYLPKNLQPKNKISHPTVKSDQWEGIIKSMVDVVHSNQGTAGSISDAPYLIAGKTGTAQVVGIKQNAKYNAAELNESHRDHALFIAFAPANNPKIAVAVIVENGGHGGSAAAPIARKVMDAYLSRRLPNFPVTKLQHPPLEKLSTVKPKPTITPELLKKPEQKPIEMPVTTSTGS